MSSSEQPRRRRRLRGTRIGKDELIRDSRGRVVDDDYVDAAVQDALEKAAKRGPEDKG